MLPLQEYPRPSLVRDSYVNLNGKWQYAFRNNQAMPIEWDGEIVVPFSPEAELSGVSRQLKPTEWLFYRRSFQAPDGDGGRVLLHFGAVDYLCRVWVNATEVGEHQGGYLPFTFDITDALFEGENLLTVEVQDPSDTGEQARGKQKIERGGMFYTAQSGIWQTVWMERVPENYVEKLKVTPDLKNGCANVVVQAANPKGAVITAKIGTEEVASCISDETGTATLQLVKDRLRLWSPEDPFLYDLEVAMPDGDRVTSYFAMRQWAVERDGAGVLRFFLNGKPYFLHGLLDQGYWKEGLYTAPTDDAMVYDIETVKSMGFNMLRKHVKIEPERWYYHCDRLGMVVWQDMVNGGGKIPMWFVTYAINVFHPVLRRYKDTNYKLFSRTNEAERARYYEELREMVEHLYNHPSIGCWVPFNEGWGQFDAPKATELVRGLDPTRPIDEASGWFDQGGGDVYSLHNYFYPLKVRPNKERVVALTEYGGVSWPCPGHIFSDKTYGYGTAKDAVEFADKFKKLIEETVTPQIANGLSALVYTQVSDVEDEVNGLLTYDREGVKWDRTTARECARMLSVDFDKCIRE